MMHAEFLVSVLKRLKLRLRSNQLGIDEINLLRRRQLFRSLVRFPRRWRFSPDIVQGVTLIYSKLRVA